jgi:hypothetical protein
MAAQEDTEVQVVIYDNCTFPAPPRKHILTLPAPSNVALLRALIVEKTGYNPDFFNFTMKNKLIVDEEQTPLYPRMMLNLVRTPIAKVKLTKCT